MSNLEYQYETYLGYNNIMIMHKTIRNYYLYAKFFIVIVFSVNES